MVLNGLKSGKTVMVTYSHVIFTILFYEYQVEKLRKAFTKEKKQEKNANDLNYCFFLLFYNLNYLNSTKFNSRLSNQKTGLVLEVTLILNSKMNIVTKFQVPIFENDGGEMTSPPPRPT